MFIHLESACEETRWSSLRPPRRLAHRCVAQRVFKRHALALDVEPAEPTWRAGPTGAQAEVDRVETNAGFIVVANSNRQRPGDGAVRHTERGGEKLAHIGPA